MGASGAPQPASHPPARIYFVGAHATGKTTLARYVRDRYGLPLISEVARSILAELEVSLDRLRANLDLVNCYQVEVFRRQIEAEREAGNTFVSDRAFCNLAYMAHHGTVMHELFRDPALEAYMHWVAGGLVSSSGRIRARPAMSVRTAIRFEEIALIDGMVKLLLEMYAVPYLTIATLLDAGAGAHGGRGDPAPPSRARAHPGARGGDEPATGEQAAGAAGGCSGARGRGDRGNRADRGQARQGGVSAAQRPHRQPPSPCRPGDGPEPPALPAGMPAIPAPSASNGGIPGSAPRALSRPVPRSHARL
jgi:hypothetical protein